MGLCLFCLNQGSRIGANSLNLFLCDEHYFYGARLLLNEFNVRNWFESEEFRFNVPGDIIYKDDLYEFPDIQVSVGRRDGWTYVHMDGTDESEHPHLDSAGEMCLGGNGDLLQKYAEQMNWESFYAIALISGGLYTQDDAFRPLVTCEACDAGDQEMIVCPNCGANVCVYCYHSELEVCALCANKCSNCGGVYGEADKGMACDLCGTELCPKCAYTEYDEETDEAIGRVCSYHATYDNRGVVRSTGKFVRGPDEVAGRAPGGDLGVRTSDGGESQETVADSEGDARRSGDERSIPF